MRVSTLVWVGAVLLLSLSLVSPPLTSAAASAEVAASATPGVYDLLVRGLRPQERASSWLTGPRQQVIATDQYRSDKEGVISVSFRLPRHYEPGRWAITVHALDSGREAIAYFEVVARGPDIALNVSPKSGPIGTRFSFAAEGFAVDEEVGFWLTAPDGQAIEGETLFATASGRVDFSVVFAEGSQTGQWSVSVYGVVTDHLGVTTITLTP